ncbi:MAG: hypothetical protein IJM79_00395 [Erysipelotrichaceae bacterium]|nr:hypothetical protein [Erysipelotrichaceae bacterium]
MEKLSTPFGEIKILIDGKPVMFHAQEGRKIEVTCPDLLGRYHITVRFLPDGKEHTIACVFEPDCSYERTLESGERLECQSFYNDSKFKMSIGVEGDMLSGEYDYDVEYLGNGMAYLLNANTKTDYYAFGIAWIDNVELDNRIDENNDRRDAETWYGADPSIPL